MAPMPNGSIDAKRHYDPDNVFCSAIPLPTGSTPFLGTGRPDHHPQVLISKQGEEGFPKRASRDFI